MKSLYRHWVWVYHGRTPDGRGHDVKLTPHQIVQTPWRQGALNALTLSALVSVTGKPLLPWWAFPKMWRRFI